MRRHDALAAAYPQLERRGTVVVTIMGAVAAELQSLGHRPNFFYLQHAMGLASSLGLGIALSRPELKVVVFDGDGSLLMNLGGLTTLARYRPKNLVHVLEQLVADLAAGRLKIVDLTQPLGPETPVIGLPPMFGASPGVTLDVISRFDAKGPAWYWNTIRRGEHTGTHFDAPVHWITGKDLPGNACDTIPPARFVGPACVIDVTNDVRANEDFLLTPERIRAWETEHGRIPAGTWVLLRTGWSARSDPAAFLNVRDDGPHSPGFHADASRLLAHDRDVLGVGVETVGTDAGQAGGFDPSFPNHTVMHGAGKFGLASLRNLDQLPATGAIVIAAPLEIVNGSGSPLRVLAIAPR